MAINNGLKLCWLSTNCPVARARKEPRKGTAKDSICMRYVNNKFGPLAGQHFWGARIKNQSPKRVTDYSRTRHVRVRVICIWMVWLLTMAGGESGSTVGTGAGYSCEGRCMGELFDCYLLVPFCGRIDRRVAGAEATSSMAPTLLLICRVSVWHCTEGKSS